MNGANRASRPTSLSGSPSSVNPISASPHASRTSPRAVLVSSSKVPSPSARPSSSKWMTRFSSAKSSTAAKTTPHFMWLSAWDVLQRGYGVCRDFAHLTVALNRTFNVPARYVTGHLPDIGFPDPENHMDFHAYAEVFLGGSWFTTDARFFVPRIGRITVSRGQDAVDGAFSTIYGGATLAYFQVWAYQVARGSVRVGDPLDLSLRLDNQWAVQLEPSR